MTYPEVYLGDYVYAKQLPDGRILLRSSPGTPGHFQMILSPLALSGLDHYRDGIRRKLQEESDDRTP